MNIENLPPWMEGWKPTPVLGTPASGAGNPKWTPGCPSPNPKGRPAGIPDKRQIVTQQMLDDLKEIVEIQIAKAKEGDFNAANIIIARCLPTVKGQVEKVRFDFDHTAPVSQQVEMVLAAVADARLSADVGRLIIDGIKSLSEVRNSEDLAARIEALEEVANARG